MEILPVDNIVKSRISLTYDRHDSFNRLKRESIRCRQSNCTPWSCFQRISGQRLVLLRYSYKEGSPISQQASEDMPISLELELISSESQFDRVVAEAQQLESSVVVLWKMFPNRSYCDDNGKMASWCRKCIYLKPKLERLAAEYYPSIRFYSIDVNNVPHKLVVRAGISKMPTIQLWGNGKKLGEVIGGHKAHLVVNEVREMLDNEDI